MSAPDVLDPAKLGDARANDYKPHPCDAEVRRRGRPGPRTGLEHWYVRFTRGTELYVLNREAGGNRAHISFHKDGRCHYKVEDPAGLGRVIAQWELPEPMEATGMRRLATVVIPHRGLVVPDRFRGPEDDTVLIPPPAETQNLEVDILVEPGQVP